MFIWLIVSSALIPTIVVGCGFPLPEWMIMVDDDGRSQYEERCYRQGCDQIGLRNLSSISLPNIVTLKTKLSTHDPLDKTIIFKV